MKRVRIVFIASMTVLLLSSCATLGKKAKPYYYFQGMAKPNSIVVTIDAKAEKALVASAFTGMDEFSRRANRVSLSLTPSGDEFPIQGNDLQAYGVVQGDYPRFLINTGMMYSSSLSMQENTDGLSWFTQKNGNLSLSAAKNDVLLFTNGSYADAYESIGQKIAFIDDETAFRMASVAIAVYADEPETFFDLGLGLNDAAVKQMKKILLLINQNGDMHTLDAYITMDNPKLAQTLSQMVRTGYLARLKKEKVPYKIADLMKMFLIEGDLLTIKGMSLTEEQMGMLEQNITGLVM
ncbi:hypothetical protein SpiGrapes_0487 [Sphaerochaeta pleomorpha str. Grapes]|uniref:Lipoprotein n=1 Tax=Sphaerochaeta pleomorpha (strain ATCC BAA-1885 / DSM 22778 / Grapes) TaxID=158190 RepID=G8QWP8_SPHPG|nr:hypothetical protein SpiGrapes_0487 [Sphaerochaeta pleomorpha str. Grapes]